VGFKMGFAEGAQQHLMAKRRYQDLDVEVSTDEASTDIGTEEILQELTCPICFGLCHAPIWQCRNGHLVCDDCYGQLERKNITSCPVCRVLLPGTERIRNLAMEKAVANLTVVCPRGCGTIHKHRDLHSHLGACPMRTCRCVCPGCSWSGVAEELHAHLHTTHGEVIALAAKTKDEDTAWCAFTLCMQTEAHENQWHWALRVNCHNESFLFFCDLSGCSKSTTHDRCSFTTLHVGSDRANTKFQARVDLKSDEGLRLAHSHAIINACEFTPQNSTNTSNTNTSNTCVMHKDALQPFWLTSNSAHYSKLKIVLAIRKRVV